MKVRRDHTLCAKCRTMIHGGKVVMVMVDGVEVPMHRSCAKHKERLDARGTR